MMEQTMTRYEVAAVFKVSQRTLRRWEDAGLLVPIRVGTTVRYRAEDVRVALGRHPKQAGA